MRIKSRVTYKFRRANWTLAFIFTSFLLNSCTTVQRRSDPADFLSGPAYEKFKQVKLSASEDEVNHILGRPRSRESQKDGTVILEYNPDPDSVVDKILIILDAASSGQVVGKEIYPVLDDSREAPKLNLVIKDSHLQEITRPRCGVEFPREHYLADPKTRMTVFYREQTQQVVALAYFSELQYEKQLQALRTCGSL